MPFDNAIRRQDLIERGDGYRVVQLPRGAGPVLLLDHGRLNHEIRGALAYGRLHDGALPPTAYWNRIRSSYLENPQLFVATHECRTLLGLVQRDVGQRFTTPSTSEPHIGPAVTLPWGPTLVVGPTTGPLGPPIGPVTPGGPLPPLGPPTTGGGGPGSPGGPPTTTPGVPSVPVEPVPPVPPMFPTPPILVLDPPPHVPTGPPTITTTNTSDQPAPTPEPATGLMLAFGLVLVLGMSWYRSRVKPSVTGCSRNPIVAAR